MRGACPRFLLKGLLVASLLALQAVGVAAQTSDPDEPEVDSEPVEAVEETEEDTVVLDASEETVEEDPEAVDEVDPSDDDADHADEADEAEASEPGADEEGDEEAAQYEGESEAASKPIDGATVENAPGQAGSETSGEASEKTSEAAAPTTASTDHKSPHLVDLVAQWYSQGKRPTSTEAGVVSSGNAVGSAQPSLAMLVEAVNDADGDGIFSGVEMAPAPGMDVRFRTSITNIGSTVFEIAVVNHTYSGERGWVRVRVCSEVIGLTLGPGDSLPCVFSLQDYSPLRGESVNNTVTAAGFGIDNARRGVSDSDTSTVETMPMEVSAISIEPETRLLAFTGTIAARLVALALMFLAAGGTLLFRYRAHGGLARFGVDGDSSFKRPGEWAAGPVRTRPRLRAGIK